MRRHLKTLGLAAVAAMALLGITGGEAPVMKIEAGVKKLAGSFFCPEKATLDAEYVFTEPHAIYVGS